jgi:hypothetical protein
MARYPQLQDAAPDLLAACQKTIESGHNDTCDYLLVEGGECTCGVWSAKKAVAYARGDDPLEAIPSQ